MEMTMGTCMYCGQTRAIKTSGEIDEQQADALVTAGCTCDGALKAATMEETLSRIGQLFGGGCREMGFEYVCDVQQERALREMSDAVLLDQFEEIKAKLPNGDMAVFKKIGGVVEISREMKRKRTV